MWLALFSAVGLSALLATGGKFGKRQSGIERRYQARNWQAKDLERMDRLGNGKVEKPRAEKPQAENTQTGSEQVAIPNYSSPAKTIVGLWPLAGVLGALCVTSLVMLLFTRGPFCVQVPPGKSPDCATTRKE